MAFTDFPHRGIILSALPFTLILLAASTAELGGGAATSFDFTGLSLGNLKLLGDAHLSNGSIHLTAELPVPNSGAGRALYSQPIRFLHGTPRRPISFSTFFSFSITHLNPSSVGGGLAFLLSSDDSHVGDAGGFLGLLNASAAALRDGAIILAVEFDTLMDPEFNDINGNHVGVDLNSMVSTDAADLDAINVDLRSGDLVNAWVDYDGAAFLLRVFVSHSSLQPSDPIISLSIDLSRFVDDFMYVGFSGSTQGSTELHRIQWWSFAAANQLPHYSSPPPSPPPTEAAHSVAVAAAAPSHRRGVAAGAAAGGGAFFLTLCTVFLLCVHHRRRRRTKRKYESDNLASDIVRSPREFSYKELSAATRGFDRGRIIGHGAFGTVYKGIIPETGAMVAVKRCTNNNGGQGRSEFISELSIIAGLRHRNLVKLQGWCRERGEILLVYDYMVNGSLDKALYEISELLSWRRRRRILTGVASALAYLHRECEHQVIHRDVKSSNVMLDEEFQARLGDFGLARQVEHDKTPEATVAAGTMGYLAPEYLLTGRATEKSDVFSFGVLVLEVACGRRPIENAGLNLMDWVWTLHGEGRLTSAADGRLNGEFEEGEMRKVLMVGLVCCHPDPSVRPTMRTAVQMLSGEMEPPLLPGSKPSLSFGSSSHHLLLSLQDSVSDCNAMAALSSSSSSSSLASTNLTRVE